jgi:hypothetical protein
MIHTEKGGLDELIAMLAKDREFVLETMGTGPSGKRSRDKTLCADGPRLNRFAQRVKDLTDIISALQHLKR